MDLGLPARHVSISVSIEETGGVGEARQVATRLAEALQFSEPDIHRVSQVVTEAATNIVQHARRGEILLSRSAPEDPGTVEVLALDQGPGMANVASALRDGFSTSGAKGLGLGAIIRLSTSFEITSAPGRGTALLARIVGVAPRRALEPGPLDGRGSDHEWSGLEWGVVCVPQREEQVCGVAWAVVAGKGRNAVLIVDGLGHGLPAFEAAEQALQAFRGGSGERPEARLKTMHQAMSKTRGAVAAIAEIDWRQRKLQYVGAGNIAGALVPEKGPAYNMVSHNGTLGREVTRFQEFTYPWPEQGLLILHSDGLSSHWDIHPYPGLTRKHPSLIAGVLYRDFASRRADVVVLVGRERESTRREKHGDAI